MSPHDERNENFIQVGIAPPNPKSIIADTHYDPNFNSDEDEYMPEDVTNDMSKQTTGFDPYNSDKYDSGVEKRRALVDENNDPFAI